MTGPEEAVGPALRFLERVPGLRWIRVNPRYPARAGFRWLGDVQYLVPRGDGPSRRLPEDLFTVYWACRTNLPATPGEPRAWEIWNEPDFHYLENSAADMAAVLKAAWWGVKAGQPDAQVLMPSLAFGPSRYALELAANGLASWTDGINLHFYGRAADYRAFLGHHEAFARHAGLNGPRWLTEVGYLGMPPSEADNPAALRRQAAFHERTMVESWAEGVDRHFLFLLSPYLEAGHDLGLTGSDGVRRPAFASAVALVRALPGTRPRWRLEHRRSGEDVGVVLERPDGTWWTVLWSPHRSGESAPPRPDRRRLVPESWVVELGWPSGISEVGVGLDRPVTVAAGQVSAVELNPERVIHLHTPPVRFRIGGCRWVRWETAGRRVPGPSGSLKDEFKALPPRRPPSPVVVRLRPDDPVRESKPAQTWRVPAHSPARAGLELCNFSESEQEGRWRLEVPPGFTVAATDTADAPAVTGSVRVPALSRRWVPLGVAWEGAGDPGPARLRAFWSGAGGVEDEASVRLEADFPPGPVWHRFGWRDLVARPAQVGAWQVFELGAGTLALEVKRPGTAERDVVVDLVLPKGRQPSDVFRAGLRGVSLRGRPQLQVFLVTPEGDVWRHGEMESVTSEGTALAARLSEFSPWLWSRHRAWMTPPVREAAWLSLQIRGAQPGDVFELEAPGLHRGSPP